MRAGRAQARSLTVSEPGLQWQPQFRDSKHLVRPGTGGNGLGLSCPPPPHTHTGVGDFWKKATCIGGECSSLYCYPHLEKKNSTSARSLPPGALYSLRGMGSFLGRIGWGESLEVRDDLVLTCQALNSWDCSAQHTDFLVHLRPHSWGAEHLVSNSTKYLVGNSPDFICTQKRLFSMKEP